MTDNGKLTINSDFTEAVKTLIQRIETQVGRHMDKPALVVHDEARSFWPDRVSVDGVDIPVMTMSEFPNDIIGLWGKYNDVFIINVVS